MVIPTIHFRSEYSNIPLRIAKGHFATNHSHINYYIDMTYTKHRFSEAREAAKELAIKFVSTQLVDTILCLDGTEVLGACLAEELTNIGVHNINEHNSIYVVTPETISAGQYIFRDNIAHLIAGRHVLVLAASVTTGNTVLAAIDAIRYYRGDPAGVCAIFSCLDECDGFPITNIFHADVLGDYTNLPANQCPLCRAGIKLDALVNSYGYSSF